jgi:hypothetical protein
MWDNPYNDIYYTLKISKLSIDKNQSEYIDMGSRKIKVHPDNANTIKQCLKNAKLTLSLHYETERAEIIAAKKIKQL